MARRVVRTAPDGTISAETLTPRSVPPVSTPPRRERDSLPPASVRELVLSRGDGGRQFGSSFMDVGNRKPKYHR